MLAMMIEDKNDYDDQPWILEHPGTNSRRGQQK